MLRDYQQKAVNDTWDYIRTQAGNPCLEMPTGSGKSWVVAALCQDALKYPDTRVLMLTHVRELVQQNAEKLFALWPDAPMGIYASGLNKKQAGYPITYGSVQTVQRNIDAIGKQDLIIVDECHRISHKSQGGYRQIIEQINPYRVIGLTASPYRLGHGYITDGDAIFDHIIKPVSIEELVGRGFLARLSNKNTRHKLSTRGVHKRGGEFIEGELQRAINTEHNNESAVSETIERADDRKAWLFFCTGVDHSYAIRDLLRERGITAETITGKTNKQERDQIIKEFKSGKIRALTNADVLTTGFDYPDIDLLVFLRPTMSPALYCLDEKTEVLTSEGFKGIDDYQRGDQVASVCMNTREINYSHARSTIRRKQEKTERMVAIKNQHLNILVSDNHDLIYETRTKKMGMRKIKAIECLSMSEIKIPTAINNKRKDCDALDCELKLLGLWATDGSINRKTNALQISQTCRHQFCIDYIEKTLQECGLKYSKRLAAKKGEYTNLGERKNNFYVYTISKGEPRGSDKHLQGWGALPFFRKHSRIKNDTNLANILSHRQMALYLHGLYIGNGKKGKISSYTICGPKDGWADRLQFIAINCGYSANISRQETADVVLISNKKNRTIMPAATDRKQAVNITDDKALRLWCLSTKHKTLIIRRYGKVAIVGNCQMAGRGMRPKSHTDHCMVLDFAGLVAQHGPITHVKPRKPGEKGEAPIKSCDNCGEIVPLGTKICPECGTAFVSEERPKIFALDESVDIMGEKTIHQLDVDDWDFSVHVSKKSEIETLKINYWSGFTKISEYLCVNHDGYAGHKAVQTLIEIAGQAGVELKGLENTTELAEAFNNNSTPPSRINYVMNGKYENIIKRTWGENELRITG